MEQDKVKIEKTLKQPKRSQLMTAYFTKGHTNVRIIAFLCFLLFLAAGIIVMQLGWSDLLAYALFAVALVAFIYFILTVFRVLAKYLKDEEVDELIESDMHQAFIQAFAYLGITKDDVSELQPLVTQSPEVFPGSKQIYFKSAKKHTPRYSQSKYNALLFGIDQLYFYGANINHINGAISYNTTQEFSYFDVVSVGSTLGIDLSDKYPRETLDLVFTLIDSQKITLRLRDHVVQNVDKGAHPITEEEMAIIVAVRSLIRDKKSAIH